MQLTQKMPSERDPSKILCIALTVMGFGAMGSMVYVGMTGPKQGGMLMPDGQTVTSPNVVQVERALRYDANCMVDSPAAVVAANPQKYAPVEPYLKARLAVSHDPQNIAALSAALNAVDSVKLQAIKLQ